MMMNPMMPTSTTTSYTRVASRPQHPDTCRNQPPRGKAARQQVYTADGSAVVEIPAHAIVHMPRSGLHIKKLVICQFFDPAQPASSCPKGDRCKFVHTTMGGDEIAARTQSTVHVNYAWRSLDAVEYPRFTDNGDERYTVAAPDGESLDSMNGSYMLKTKALTPARSSANPAAEKPPVLRHCAHYYYNRTCNLGPDCHFVHAVFIDPKACKNQRAPAPRALERMHQQAMLRRSASAAPTTTTTTTVDDAQIVPATPAETRRTTCDSPIAIASGGELSRESTPASMSVPLSPSKGLSTCTTGRYRHDPYSNFAFKCCTPASSATFSPGSDLAEPLLHNGVDSNSTTSSGALLPPRAAVDPLAVAMSQPPLRHIAAAV